MIEDGLQGMLFGSSLAGEDSADSGLDGDLRICALNVQNPSATRAQQVVDWLLACGANTLVLTEVQLNQGGRHILASLEAEGFSTVYTPANGKHQYFSIIATRGLHIDAVTPAPFDPRVIVADVGSADNTARIVGLYGPTNAMTAESSHSREKFQKAFLAYLFEIEHAPLIVVGDFNIVEPGHRPSLSTFEEHDYEFYRGLLKLGLRDAYRTLNPAGGDHSWISERFGSQRLDHTFVADSLEHIRSCGYDHSTRGSGLSDHAAMLTCLNFES